MDFLVGVGGAAGDERRKAKAGGRGGKETYPGAHWLPKRPAAWELVFRGGRGGRLSVLWFMELARSD